MDLTPDVKDVVSSAAARLKGASLRRFMADIVRKLGYGGQRKAHRELGWDRTTVRKGEHELRTGIDCLDGRAGNTRAGVDDQLPNLKADIRDIVEAWSQTDPRFRTPERYAKLAVSEVVERLIANKGYKDQELPSNETIRKLMHGLGYRLQKVQKTKPKKRSRRPTTSSASSMS